jgi:hypothetical protein
MLISWISSVKTYPVPNCPKPKKIKSMIKITETHPLADEVELQMLCDKDGGEIFDTRVIVDGEFWVSGNQRLEFKDKLAKLINEYRI